MIDYRTSQLETEPSHYRGFKVEAESDSGRKFREWICHLPKTLWELGSNNLPATEVRLASFGLPFNHSEKHTSQTILRLLLRLKQRKSSLIDGDVMTPHQ
jgi:pre-rRNA-processing protein IPI1